MGSVFFTILQALDEQVTEPSAFDMGAREALRFEQPPCKTMDTLGRDAVKRLLEPLCDTYDTPLPRSLERVGSLVS